MADKEFKTIDEQVEILKSRGLLIEDEKRVKEFLLNNNYYRISGYSLTLRKNDVFSKTATFQNIIDIYSFDQELRHIVLRYLEIIEVRMKSVFAYEFSRIHGPAGYLDSVFFTDSEKHDEIIAKANKQKETRLPHEAYLKHFVKDLKQDVPLWAYVDLFTIADISFLYSISESSIKDSIARTFGLIMKDGSIILGNFMHGMTIIRNLCAHGSRIYNRLFEQKPSLNKKEKELLIKGKNGIVDNAHFYGFVMIMKRLLIIDDFKELKSDIIKLTGKYPFVRMRYYGFREDWQEKL